jgi:uncharacterized protein
MQMSGLAKTILLLCVSNTFMLTAWYLHLKVLGNRPWYLAVVFSWGIAFFEYCVHIPANRVGHHTLSIPSLQILQVGMSLLFFIPFAYFVLGIVVKADYLIAAGLIFLAGYFIFRK